MRASRSPLRAAAGGEPREIRASISATAPLERVEEREDEDDKFRRVFVKYMDRRLQEMDVSVLCSYVIEPPTCKLAEPPTLLSEA